MAPAPKDARFEMRLSAEEREMLRALADDAGESEATVMRQLLKRAHEALEARVAKKKR
jgi:hypothetical protein